MPLLPRSWASGYTKFQARVRALLVNGNNFVSLPADEVVEGAHGVAHVFNFFFTVAGMKAGGVKGQCD